VHSSKGGSGELVEKHRGIQGKYTRGRRGTVSLKKEMLEGGSDKKTTEVREREKEGHLQGVARSPPGKGKL